MNRIHFRVVGFIYLHLLFSVAALWSEPLRLGFVGDIMAHDSNFKMQDFSRIYGRVRHLLQQTDLNFANLEFVVDDARPYSTYPSFNVHTEYVTAAIDAGFNVFSLANNHSTDFGLAGVRATKQRSLELQQEYPGIAFSGLRSEPSTSFSMESIRYKGWNLGFTAISILTNSTKGIEAVQYIRANDEPRLKAFYRWLKEQRLQYDLLVVSVHGGKEYQLEASAQKRGIMRNIAQNGANIVWGHHPHVQQAWEVYQHDETHRWSLIMYSQGNFISAQTIRTKANEPQSFWAATGDSVLLQVQIQREGRQLQLQELNGVLLSTIRLQNKGRLAFGVVPMEDAAKHIYQEGYRGWDAFYAQRHKILQERTGEWPQLP